MGRPSSPSGGGSPDSLADHPGGTEEEDPHRSENIYLSLTPAFTVLSLEGGLHTFEFHDLVSSPGFGLKFAVGKEWWVSDHWGLGLALEFDFASNRETVAGFTTTWTSFGGSILFSATYN